MSADRVRWEHITRVYELCDRNVSETARRLKMHRRTLQRTSGSGRGARRPAPSGSSACMRCATRWPIRRAARRRLVVTRNAADRLAEAIAASGMAPEIVDPRRFDVPLDPQSVHQGAALEVEPLDWGSVSEVCAPRGEAPLVLLLDRVTDPHNVGAILRSAEVFGARAVIAPRRHAAPETGALAKAASGALERQPYLRVPNLAGAMGSLREMGYAHRRSRRGGGGGARRRRSAAFAGRPLALALGAEGPGMRELTGKLCDRMARIPAAGAFGSLNVSNAAAVALYARGRARADDVTWRSHFPGLPFGKGLGPHMMQEAAGVEPPCFISLSLVPTRRPDTVRALFCDRSRTIL